MKKIFGTIVIIALIAGFTLIGCEPGNSNAGNGNGNSNSNDSIVNAAEEAWVNTDINMAYVFLANGTYKQYTRPGDTWLIYDEGSYQVSGTSVSIDNSTYQFTVSGNTLTFTVSGTQYTYTRTQPFTPGIVTPPTGQLDQRLVLPEGQGWKQLPYDAINWFTEWYVFKSDGTYSFYGLEDFIFQSEGTWSTNGNTLTLKQTGITGDFNYTYNVSGDTLTLTRTFGSESDTYTYIKSATPR